MKMKKLIFGILTVAAFALAALLPLAGGVSHAQNSNGKDDKNKQKARPRDLFIQKEEDASKGKSGAKVRILLKRGSEQQRFVSPNENFYSGDKIKLAFDINFAGHIALLNVGSSGKITMLYPYPGASSAVEPMAKEQLIPANQNDWITFDNRAGSEQITVVFSTNPINQVDQVIQMSGQNASNGGNSNTGNATANGNANTTVNVNGNNSTIYVATTAQAQAILEELNSRSLKRSKTRDLYVETVNNEATYAVAETSLISEPTAFVITLKHQNR